MLITKTALSGATIIDPELQTDSRGFFARTFSWEDFAGAGLDPMVEQCSLAYNHRAGTVRGMHYQLPPAAEAKLVRCTRGAIVDIIVDMRPDSETYLQHIVVYLTAENRRALYVPPMFAHGYQTLVDATEVSYQISERYTPGVERGLRYDDKALALPWPAPVTVVSDKDQAWPLTQSVGSAP